ncbi:MAG TPA: plastocyanin/azurin family copper-binding protein [Thermoplasmata archaeon]|nr:plastocyanin/azurin family copper-binding protein [Thermoplasmata archaeon]
MSGSNVRQATVAFVVVVLLVGSGAVFLVTTAPARAASAIDDTGASTFSVTAESGFSFTPNSIGNLPTNGTVTVTFTDNDALAHTFTIIGKQGWVIPVGISDSSFDTLVWGANPRALVNANTTPAGTSGDQNITSFTAPGKGWYEFVCTEPGHFQNGMYGFVAFGEPVPSNLSVSAASTDPGIAVFIIVGTIVGLVVVALVLGFVVGRRRGSSDEMVPQRLGYPEPESEPEASSDVPPSPPRSGEPRG